MESGGVESQDLAPHLQMPEDLRRPPHLNADLERAELLRSFLQRVQEAVAAARQAEEGGAGRA
jgi:hypothetical protein